MASTARIDELKKKFDENPRRYFAPLANEFRKSGDIEQAIVICEEFLPQQPGHMSGHIVYGQALYEAGRMPESRTVFETALGLDPENLIALRHLGDIAHGQADLDAARSWYLRVLDADPRNDEIQALIASIPAPASAQSDAVQIISEDDFDLAGAMAEPAEVVGVGVPSDIEKEEPALEAVADLGDTHPLGIPVVPPPLPTTELIEGFSMHGFEGSPDRDSDTLSAHAPAEGLESTTFTPPEETIAGIEDLDDSLDSGVPSFDAPTQVIPALDGLQGISGHTQPPRYEDVDTEEFAAAERPVLDEGTVLPPQGDPLAASAHSAGVADYAPAPQAEAELLDFDMDGSDAITEPVPVQSYPGDATSHVDEDAGQERAGEYESPVEADFAGELGGAVEDEAPMELSAAVLAAETELIESGETPEPEPAFEPEYDPSAELEDESAVAPMSSAPFDTETMAELYVAQGLHEQALGVYARLLAANPSDVRLQGLVASLTPAQRPREAEPTVREFFARMASRRPGVRGAAAVPPAEDDFADFSPITEPLAAPLAEDVAADAPDDEPEPAQFFEPAAEEAVPEPVADLDEDTEEIPAPAAEPHTSSSDVAPAIERAAAMRTPTGSIDALFNHRSPGTSEDSAASALAQAFGATAEAEPLIVGRPARAASAELSLDSVFRDGPPRQPRTSQSFSFDQFFTPGASSSNAADRASDVKASRSSGEMPAQGEPPAERSADDIQQFNSWLQGLKPR